MNPEEKTRIVTDALNQLTIPRPVEPDEFERLRQRGENIARDVAKWAREIEAAREKANRPQDRKALSALLSRMFIERFDGWSKEELLMHLVMLHTEVAMENL